MNMAPPHVDVTVNIGNIRTAMEPILERLRPQWKEEWAYEIVTGGFMNNNYRCFSTNSNDSIFLRVINQDWMSDIFQSHLKACQLLHKNAIGPKLLCTFNNGTCVEFIYGETIGWPNRQRLFEPSIARDVARQMATYHTRALLNSAYEAGIKVYLHHKFYKVEPYWDEFLKNPHLPDEIRSKLPSKEELLNCEREDHELNEQLNFETALCHGDLNMANLMIKEDKTLIAVDFDVVSIGFIPYDMAWHFGVFTDLDNPKFDELSDDYKKTWLRHYLEYRRELDGDLTPVTDQHVRLLLFQITKAIPLTVLRMTIGAALVTVISPDSANVQLTLQMANISAKCWQHYLEIKERTKTMMLEDF